MEIHQENIQSFLLERGLSSSDPQARSLVEAELNVDQELMEEFFGHGPLLELLNDSSLTEILVNGADDIWVEKSGTLIKTTKRFSGEESLKRYVRRILSSRGRKVDHASPFADAVLEDGTRVHVAIPPVSRNGYCLSFRKFQKSVWSMEKLAQKEMLSHSMVQYLEESLLQKKNIFLCGGTGSGKTTLLGALLESIPFSERVIALEDIAEIRTTHPHFLTMEVRPANQEGLGELGVRRLLKESLRMRPDRIVIGECRGPEALDLIMALNTGHRGSMATIHANSPRDALSRLETLALLAAENMRESAIRNLIVSSVDVVIHIERKECRRRISSITELKGIDGGTYMLREVKF